jgi:hypothetical protein
MTSDLIPNGSGEAGEGPGADLRGVLQAIYDAGERDVRVHELGLGESSLPALLRGLNYGYIRQNPADRSRVSLARAGYRVLGREQPFTFRDVLDFILRRR